MFSFFKKTWALYLIATFLFIPLATPPQKAYAAQGKGPLVESICSFFGGTLQNAVSGALDTGSLFGNSVPVHDAAVAQSQATETCSSIVGGLVSTLIEILRKQLLDALVDQIIAWIQGGGEPQFVSDWSGFLKDAADKAFGEFIYDTDWGFLCSPLQFQIIRSLAPIKKFSQQVRCTLTQIVSNIDSFYEDIRNGGWIAYRYSWHPENNFFGLLEITGTERLRRMTDAQLAAQNEAISGGGFLSQKNCPESPDGIGPDIDRDGIPGDIASRCEVVTPGKTIGDLTSKAIGSDIDYIISANELSEYVTAIADAVINRLIIEGIDGLKGVSTKNSPSGGYIPQGGTSACAGLASPAYETCFSYATGNYIDVGGGLFENAKADMLGKIASSTAVYASTQTILADSLSVLTVHLSNLQNLTASFNALVCTNKSAYLAATNAETAWALPVITGVQNTLTLITADIGSLNSAKTQIENLPKDSWVSFTQIKSALDTSGILNLATAEAVKNAASTENANIKAHTVSALTNLNNSLTSCQAGI